MDACWSENAKCYIFEIPHPQIKFISPLFQWSETWNMFKERIYKISIFVWSPFVTDIESYGHNNHQNTKMFLQYKTIEVG